MHVDTCGRVDTCVLMQALLPKTVLDACLENVCDLKVISFGITSSLSRTLFSAGHPRVKLWGGETPAVATGRRVQGALTLWHLGPVVRIWGSCWSPQWHMKVTFQ